VDVETEPIDQDIYEGQNAIFECRLIGNNGRLVPVEWLVLRDESLDLINMNSTQHYILPPANSVLVFVNTSLNFPFMGVQCFGPGERLFPEGPASLIVQGECIVC